MPAPSLTHRERVSPTAQSTNLCTVGGSRETAVKECLLPALHDVIKASLETRILHSLLMTQRDRERSSKSSHAPCLQVTLPFAHKQCCGIVDFIPRGSEARALCLQFSLRLPRRSLCLHYSKTCIPFYLGDPRIDALVDACALHLQLRLGLPRRSLRFRNSACRQSLDFGNARRSTLVSTLFGGSDALIRSQPGRLHLLHRHSRQIVPHARALLRIVCHLRGHLCSVLRMV